MKDKNRAANTNKRKAEVAGAIGEAHYAIQARSHRGLS